MSDLHEIYEAHKRGNVESEVLMRGEPMQRYYSGYMANKPKGTLQKWAELMGAVCKQQNKPISKN